MVLEFELFHYLIREFVDELRTLPENPDGHQTRFLENGGFSFINKKLAAKSFIIWALRLMHMSVLAISQMEFSARQTTLLSSDFKSICMQFVTMMSKLVFSQKSWVKAM